MAELKDANTNPWYVLMTLYGEQEGRQVDYTVHAQNRAVWNAWSCQGLKADEAAKVANQTEVDVAETRGWTEIADEMKRLHRDIMEDRNQGSDFVYPGFPEFLEDIEFNEIQFSKAMVFIKCILTRPISFISASFTGSANFSSVTFMQAANFSSANFKQPASFYASCFMRVASFNSVTFRKNAGFRSATFSKDADFRFVAFEQSANFRFVAFNQSANFHSTSFKCSANFSSANFMQTSDFNSTNFDGPAKFGKTEFGLRGSANICVPDFTEAAFARLVSFRDVDFVSHYPVLEGAEFREAVVVTAKPTKWPDIGLVLLDEGYQGSRECPDQRGRKGILCHIAPRTGETGYAGRRAFSFSAARCGLPVRSGTPLERLPYQAFDWFSNFGQSIALPVRALGEVFFIGLVALFGFFAPTLGWLKALGLAAAISFSNLLPAVRIWSHVFEGPVIGLALDTAIPIQHSNSYCPAAFVLPRPCPAQTVPLALENRATAAKRWR